MTTTHHTGAETMTAGTIIRHANRNLRVESVTDHAERPHLRQLAMDRIPGWLADVYLTPVRGTSLWHGFLTDAGLINITKM